MYCGMYNEYVINTSNMQKVIKANGTEVIYSNREESGAMSPMYLTAIKGIAKRHTLNFEDARQVYFNIIAHGLSEAEAVTSYLECLSWASE